MAEWVEVLKALANKNRLEIFQYLRREGSSSETPGAAGQASGPEAGQGVTELAKIFALSPSTISEHLKELRRAGLIKVSKTGPWVKCWVNQDMLKELSGFFAPDKEQQ